MKKGGKTSEIPGENTINSKKVSLTVKVKKSAKNKGKNTKKKIIPAKANEKQAAVLKNSEITPKEKEIVEKIISAKEENLKMKIMYSGVSFFMIVIILFWVYNTKQIIEHSKITDNDRFTGEQWKDVAREFSLKIEEIKTDLEKIDSFDATSTDLAINKLPQSASSSDNMGSYIDSQAKNATTSTSTKPEVSQEEINILKEKLKELEQKLYE